MKTFLKVLLGIVGVFALGMAAVFYFTADMTGAADDFFTAVKNKNMDKAYTYLSEDFRSAITQEDLQQYLEKNSLSKFSEASWDSRSINGGRGKLTGSITTDSGGVVPITLSFVKAENGWKIYSLQKPSSGVQQESSTREMPSEQDLVKMVNQSMGAFGESVNNKSMGKFHGYISNLWQQQYSVEKLEAAYGPFYQSGLDLTLLKNFSPSFDSQPSIDQNGVLLIVGNYPTKPTQVLFEHKYIYEGLSWKLLGFKIETR